MSSLIWVKLDEKHWEDRFDRTKTTRAMHFMDIPEGVLYKCSTTHYKEDDIVACSEALVYVPLIKEKDSLE